MTAPRRGPIGLFAFPLEQPEFCLEDAFLERFAGLQPEWGPVGYVTYKRTYARAQDASGTSAFRLTLPGSSEEWWQTLARVVEGTYRIQQRHCALHNLHWRDDVAQRSAQSMFELMWGFKFLPPGRGLWMMGTEFIRTHGSAALNNCAFCSTGRIDVDFSRPFVFLMDMSMLGVGVGFDTEGRGKVTLVAPGRGDDVLVIRDCREGWLEALKRVLDAYVGRALLPKAFDYSEVRPGGSPIRGFGGVAAGPEPLRQLLEEDLPQVLSRAVGRPIDSATIVDVANLIGRCVVAGNVRRSAEIAFGDPNDDAFLKLKDPESAGEALAGWRWTSNNSVRAQLGMDYRLVAAHTAKNGEPGYLWLENARAFGRMLDPPDHRDMRVAGANPCVEQSLEDQELCCLVETFPARHDSYDDFERTLKWAYLYAKTVTLLPTHDPRANAVLLRNRRIGTSQSGIVQNFARVGRREHFRWCDRGYNYLRKLDARYSEWLAVPTSIKITSVKPSGTVSKLCGATSGIHYPPSRFYIQRIRFPNNSPLLDELRAAGYPMEPDLHTPATTVVEFPVEEKDFVKGADEVSMWEQLLNAVQMQRYWADNQVSCTVSFDPSEADQIADALELLEDQLKGISFLPRVGHGYQQAPWEPIAETEYRRRRAAISRLAPVTKDTGAEPVPFCDSDLCALPSRAAGAD